MNTETLRDFVHENITNGYLEKDEVRGHLKRYNAPAGISSLPVGSVRRFYDNLCKLVENRQTDEEFIPFTERNKGKTEEIFEHTVPVESFKLIATKELRVYHCNSTILHVVPAVSFHGVVTYHIIEFKIDGDATLHTFCTLENVKSDYGIDLTK